jgi:general secretion pathway protein B
VPAAAAKAVAKRSKPAGGNVSKRGARRKQQIEAPASTRKQPVQTVQAPADIKLSGIAWQDQHTARRAVINGFLLKEGSVISGSKIVDIQADKVRFSTPSGEFEIKLDAVLSPEIKK